MEVSTKGLTAKNSTSLQRAPGPLSSSVKGEATHFPFWPGGLDQPELVKTVAQRPPELSLNLGNGEFRLSVHTLMRHGSYVYEYIVWNLIPIY